MKRVIVSLGFLLATIAGCQPKHARQSAEPVRQRKTTTTAPASSPTQSEFAGPGIRLTYPAAPWTPAPSKDYALLLTPKSPDGNSISLEVPKLPAHLPGFIPIPAVVNGYTDDLKKQHPGISIEKPVPIKVAGADGRRVRSSWPADQPPRAEDAVLIVHGDRVYIFRANAAQAGNAESSHALDGILGSVQWQ